MAKAANRVVHSVTMILCGWPWHTTLTKQWATSHSTTKLALHYFRPSIFLLGMHPKEIAQLEKGLMTQKWIKALMVISQNVGNLQRADNTKAVWKNNKQFHTVMLCYSKN